MSTFAIAKSLLAGHRRLGRHFPGDFFGDPTLMILLDLFVAGGTGRELSVGTCCLASGAPHATALRRLRLLENASLIERRPHPEDARSSVVRLAPSARTALAAWIADLERDIAGRSGPGPREQ
jgi:hypothetical protein